MPTLEEGMWRVVQQGGLDAFGPVQVAPEDNSIEQFIAEHYWGYSQQKNGTAFEYRVRHDPWKVWRTGQVEISCDFAKLYGDQLAETLGAPPDCSFIADGSAITVSFPQRLF